MILSTPLETPHLALSSLDPESIGDRYVSWLNDPEVNAFLEVRFAKSEKTAVREFVGAHNKSDNSLLLGIFLKESGQHIGNIKLGPIDRVHRLGELGILVGEKKHWGKGYATEAIRGLVDYAHDRLGLVKVTAGVYASNIGSQKAFLKAGFVEEARLRSHRVNGATRDDQLMFAHFAIRNAVSSDRDV
jgi:RimJ/RimL family protein N-acetyltransferase